MNAVDEMRAALAAVKTSNERIAAELAKAKADHERIRDAAPDLLAALRRLLDCASAELQDSHAAGIAYAAIAKATAA